MASMTTLLERCRIQPLPGAATELTLPLTHFDMPWVHLHLTRRLLFYEFPCSKAYFLETIVPKLKHSLSLTLKHYVPLAGNLLYPLDTENKPIIRYVAGDSVSLTISESRSDFDGLIGNHSRDVVQFYDFVPQLPEISTYGSDYKSLQVLALQVTFFPNRGMCFGFTNHHVVGDASSIVDFTRAWASINKHGGDEEFLIKQGNSLPLFDRSMVRDPLGLESIHWNQIKGIPFESTSLPLPANCVRATYTLAQSEIKKLKDSVLGKRPSLVYVSSFAVTAAYVWTCLVNSLTGLEQRVEGDEPEYFVYAVDCRSRLDPPVPANYFGNCVTYGMAKIRHQELVGNDGFFIAAEAIANDIKNRLKHKDKVMEGAENWLKIIPLILNSSLRVAGSPKFDLYEADFGWGKVRKVEILTIDGDKYSLSLNKSRDSDGGIEIGLSLVESLMDAFAANFAHGIKSS